jgi:hypothetical protein
VLAAQVKALDPDHPTLELIDLCESLRQMRAVVDPRIPCRMVLDEVILCCRVILRECCVLIMTLWARMSSFFKKPEAHSRKSVLVFT